MIPCDDFLLALGHQVESRQNKGKLEPPMRVINVMTAKWQLER